MHLLPQDERHLHHALTLARDAIGLASPNPTVGCVIARGNEILGQGAHLYDNRDHAEIAALKAAAARGHNVRDATACVTLEPCSHHGRTGPCSDALITAGIARCVIATVDPNPQVAGSGIARLRAAGVEVLLAKPNSALAHQARQINDAFAFSIQHNRPFVTLKAALSVDGKLAPPPSQRTTTAPHWLTGEAARLDVQNLRHASDAILTGIGTVLADNPSLTDRTTLPRRRPLLRVVLDSNLRIPLDSNLVRSANGDVLLVCGSNAPQAIETSLESKGVEVLRANGVDQRPELHHVLDVLADRAIRSLLIEAGPAVNGSFLRADLVDWVVFYYSETELGNDALPFADGIASPYLVQQRLQRIDRTTFPHGLSEDIRISGYLHDPWTGLIPNP